MKTRQTGFFSRCAAPESFIKTISSEASEPNGDEDDVIRDTYASQSICSIVSFYKFIQCLAKHRRFDVEAFRVTLTFLHLNMEQLNLNDDKNSLTDAS